MQERAFIPKERSWDAEEVNWNMFIRRELAASNVEGKMPWTWWKQTSSAYWTKLFLKGSVNVCRYVLSVRGLLTHFLNNCAVCTDISWQNVGKLRTLRTRCISSAPSAAQVPKGIWNVANPNWLSLVRVFSGWNYNACMHETGTYFKTITVSILVLHDLATERWDRITGSGKCGWEKNKIQSLYQFMRMFPYVLETTYMRSFMLEQGTK